MDLLNWIETGMVPEGKILHDGVQETRRCRQRQSSFAGIEFPERITYTVDVTLRQELLLQRMACVAGSWISGRQK